MRRKSKNRAVKKTPVFAPFSDSYGIDEFVDPEFVCVQDANEEDIETLDEVALEVLRDSRQDDLYDLMLIIEDMVDRAKDTPSFSDMMSKTKEQRQRELDSNTEILRRHRKEAQKLREEIRIIEARIEMLNNENEEVAIAI